MAGEASEVLLIQFARAPVPGSVKTRMMPRLSATDACNLHCELVLWTCRRLLDSGLGAVELSVAGGAAYPLFDRCREMGVARVSEQSGSDLGQRMYRALRGGLVDHKRVILVGSDCPGIDEVYLGQALLSLEHAPVVLGPATDGGYVLIGASRIHEQVFEGIPWGTDQVFARSIAALDAAGLDWQALPELADIDRPQDLAIWESLSARER